MASVNDFIQAFDPSNNQHIIWFKRMVWCGENMMDVNILDEVNRNPMGLKLDKVLDWAQIHFCLAMKYTKWSLRETH
jgi:hypothetical protein